MIIDGFAIFAGLVALFGGLYIARNTGIVKNYEATVKAQSTHIAGQDLTIKDLQERVTKLEGERDGYAFAVEAFVKAVADAGLCVLAWDCDDRVIPTIGGPAKRSHHTAIEDSGAG